MGRVLIIAEGQTEEKFLKSIVFPYFYNKGLYSISVSILPSKIMASGQRYKGGNITTNKVVDYAKRLIHSGSVTTFFDYYGINEEFVGYKESLSCRTIKEKKECIENKLKCELNFPNFMPYIQMFEFEGLLFTNLDSFELIDNDKSKIQQLKDETLGFETPEHINNSKITAPSKRIETVYKQYGKTTDGILIAEEIGLTNILAKCHLFREWIERIEIELKK